MQGAQGASGGNWVRNRGMGEGFPAKAAKAPKQRHGWIGGKVQPSVEGRGFRKERHQDTSNRKGGMIGMGTFKNDFSSKVKECGAAYGMDIYSDGYKD